MTSLLHEFQTNLANAIRTVGIVDIEPKIDTNPSFGDLSSNVALIAFAAAPKGTWKSPHELAQKIVEHMEKDKSYTLSVAGPGFVNATATPSFLLTTLQNLKTDVFADLQKVSGNKIVIEYSSPNIAKPFTVGHLRSTIIGDALANLFEAKGYTVYRDNHLGDWGTQFGKLITAIKLWPGDFNQIETSEKPVQVLVDLYIKFHAEAEKNPSLDDEARSWFKKLEDGDSEAKELWQKCIDWSWKEFDRLYQELGIDTSKFENDGRGYGESYFEDKMQPVIDELKEKHLLTTGNEGAQIVEFPSEEFPPLMILKKDGSSLYATRDLATDKFRLEKYGKDIVVVNEVGAEQSLYFKQLFFLEGMLGWYKSGQRVHVGHGHFRFKEGKMSTRKGNVIWLEDVLQESFVRAKKLAKDQSHEETAHQVGIGALKWNDLKRSAHLDIVFDWDEVLNMQGNSGPYVQYAAVRCQSVLGKAKHESREIAQNYITNEEELEVLRKLAKFSTVINECIEEFAPHYLCTYLYEVAQAFSTFYNKHQILEQGDATAFRLLLTETVGSVLKQGLLLLGITTPEKM